MLERAAQAAARRNGLALRYIGRDMSGTFGDLNGTVLGTIGGAAALWLDRSYSAPAGTLGPNLLANSAFADASAWTVINAASISGGVASLSNGGQLRQYGPAVTGRTYRVAFDVLGTGGNIGVYSIGGNGGLSTTVYAGRYEFTISGWAGGGVQIVSFGFDGQLDNVTLREVSTGAWGPELVTNGTFADATGWAADSSFSVSGGVANFTGQAGFMQQAATSIVAGRTYLLSYDLNITAGAIQFQLGGTAVPTGHSAGTSGRRSFYLTAVSTASPRCYSNAATGWVDNVSVREVLGRHARQAISASRPTVQRMPSGYAALLFDGGDDYLAADYVDIYNAGSSTVIAAVIGAPLADRRLLALGSTATNQPFYCTVQNDTNTGGYVSQLIRSDGGNLLDQSTSHPNTAFDNTPHVISVIDSGAALMRRVDGGALSTVSYTRSGSLTTDTYTIGGIVRTAGAALWPFGGQIALIADGPGVAPDVDRLHIERFGALLAGAPYTG